MMIEQRGNEPYSDREGAGIVSIAGLRATTSTMFRVMERSSNVLNRAVVLLDVDDEHSSFSATLSSEEESSVCSSL